MTPVASIPILMAEVVQRVEDKILASLQADNPNIQKINYEFGNFLEIIARLAVKEANPTEKGRKYPAVLLLEDIPIDKSRTFYDGIATMQMFIIVSTNSDWTSLQRENESFYKILRPIYNELRQQLSRQPEFVIQNAYNMEHSYIERKYWGTTDGGSNVIGDYIDAIELKNLSFAINYKYCLTPINTD